MSVLSGMSRSRKSRTKRRGRLSTSSRSPHRVNDKMMALHTKGWNANQAPVAPSTPSQARGATDQDSDISRVSESRGAGSSDSSSNGFRCKGGVVIVQLRVAPQAVSASEKHPQSSDSSSNGFRCKGGRSDCSVESRITSSERKREASAEKQTSDESDGPRLLRIAQEAFAGYSSSLEPRSSDDGTTRQGCNHAGGWPSAMDYYNYYAWHWNTYGNYSQVLARGAWAQQWQPSANAPLLQFHTPPIQPPYAQPPLEPPPLLPAPTNQRAAGTCAGRIDISYTYVGAHAKIADWANDIRSMRLVVLVASCFDTGRGAHANGDDAAERENKHSWWRGESNTDQGYPA